MQKIQREARLMFSLLDAFESDQPTVSAPVLSRWREAKNRINASGNYEAEAALFHEILTEFDSAGAFDGTWIKLRWQAAQSRIAEEE